MSTIPVNLPGDLQEFVQARIGVGSFANESDYIVALVEAARRKRTELETALLDGLQSGPAEEWTNGEFDEMKQRVIHRDIEAELANR